MKKLLRLMLLAALFVPLGATAQTTPDTVHNMATSGSDTLRTCSATIYDDGGANGNYSSNCDATLVLLPNAPGQYVAISGTSYTESTYDYITIYEGVGTSGSVLWTDYGIDAQTPFGPFDAAAITIHFHSDGSVARSGFEINVSCINQPTCLPVTNLIAAATSTSSINLSWTDLENTGASYTVTYVATGGTDTTTVDNINATTCDITGLTAGTWYTGTVSPNCTDGTSGRAVAFRCFVPCVTSPVPYFEGFESSSVLDCWVRTLDYVSYGTVYPRISTTCYEGSGSLYMYNDNFIVSPKVNLAGNQMHVSFMARNSSAGAATVGYTTNPSDVNSYVPVITLPNTNSEWVYFEFYTDTVTADTIYVAFSHTTYSATYIDNLRIEEATDCRRPANYAILDTATTSSNVTLYWSPNGTATEYEVAYNTVKDLNTIVVAGTGITDTSYEVTGLNPGVMYRFWVRSVCDDGTTTEWTYVGKQRTLCSDTAVVPYRENFLDYNSYQIPACWTQLQTYNSGSSLYPYVSSSGYLYFYPQYGQPNTIAMPRFNLPANQLDVTVKYHNNSWGDTYQGVIEVGYVTTLDTNAMSTFTVIDTLVTDYATVMTYNFNTSELVEETDTIYIAFRVSSPSAYAYGYIDEVEVVRYSTCPRPANIAVSAHSHEGATLVWDTLEVNTYDVRYSTLNNVNDPDVVEITGLSDPTVTITGCDSNTTYYTWVRSVCDDDESIWVAGPSFNTLCGPDGCIVDIEMFDRYGDGWNGYAVNVFMDDSLFVSATIATGYDNRITTSICGSTKLDLVSAVGSFPDEITYKITVGLVEMTGTGHELIGDTLFSTVGCPACFAPTSIVVDSFTTTTISVSWVPSNDYDDTWVVNLNGTIVDTVNTPYYTYTGLTAATTYTVGVATLCGNATGFTTLATRTDCATGTCFINFDMVDSYGDGWNDGGFYVSNGDSLNAELITIETGAARTLNYPVCNGDTILLTFTRGNYPGEMSFSIATGDGCRIADNASGLDYAEGDTLMFGALQCRSCIAPEGLAVTRTTANSITATWTAGASAWYVTVADTAGNVVASGAATTPTYTATGLAEATPYIVTLAAVCGTDTSCSISVPSATRCSGTALPWHDDFSAYTELTPEPGCWSAPVTNFYNGYTYPSFIGTGRYSLLAYSGAESTKSVVMAATPQLLNPANNLYVRILGYTGVVGSATTTTFEAGVMTDLYDTSTFIPVLNFPATNEMAIEQEFLTSELPITDSAYVAIRVSIQNDADQEGYIGLVLNNIYIDAIPPCARPDSVVATAVAAGTTASATITWPAVAGSTGYTVEVVGDTTFTTTTNSATLTGLPGNTSYTVRVYNRCSANEQSLPRTTFFTTPCVGFAVPYREDFEAQPSNDIADCWNRLAQYPSSDGYMTPYVYNYSYYAHSGSQTLRFLSTSTAHSMAVSPAIVGPINNVNVSFWVYGTSSMGFVAGLMTDPTDTSTFIPMLNVPNTSSAQTQYEFSTDSLTLTDTVFHFALKAVGTSTSAYYLYLDDILIANIPDCSEAFRSASIVDVMSDSAGVVFEADLGRNVGASYSVRVLDASTNAPVANFGGASSPIALTNLLPSTTYKVLVELNCSGTVTATSDTLIFTTRCANGTLVDLTDSTSAFPTSYGYVPIHVYFNNSLSQQIYPAAELGGPLSISSISINCSTSTTADALTDFTGQIYLLEVPSNVTTITDWYSLDALNLVYSGTMNVVAGWNEFLLSAPFEYSGTGNLVVCFHTTGSYKGGYYFSRHEASPNSAIYYYNDDTAWDTTATPNTFSSGSYLADMRFFSCGNAVCEAPMITSDTVGENEISITYTATGENFEVAIIEGEWNDSTSAATLTPVATTDTFYTFTGLTANTTYSVAVRAVCGNSFYSDWAVRSITTLEHPCFVPTAVTVSDISFDAAVIGWTPGENETQWQVNVTGPSYDQTFNANTNPYTLTGLASNETYTVRVRAICSETQQSDWSETAQFTTERCQPVSGVTATATTFQTATVSWNPASNGSGNYEVEYGLSGFRQGDGTRVTVNGATTYTIAGLDSETNYDVYVRSICSASLTSSWSTVATFTTPDAGGTEQYTVTVNYDATRGTVIGAGTYYAGTQVTLTATSNPGYRFAGWSNGEADSNYTFILTENVTLTANFEETVGIDDVDATSVSLYPNPATTTVTLTGLEPGAKVTIVDLNGREISNFKIQNSKFEIDVTSLASGAYYVRITGQRQQAVRKLIVK